MQAFGAYKGKHKWLTFIMDMSCSDQEVSMMYSLKEYELDPTSYEIPPFQLFPGDELMDCDQTVAGIPVDPSSLRSVRLQHRHQKGTNIPKFVLKEFKNYIESEGLTDQSITQFRELFNLNQRNSIPRAKVSDLRWLCSSARRRQILRKALGQQRVRSREVSAHSYLHYGIHSLKIQFRAINKIITNSIQIN